MDCSNVTRRLNDKKQHNFNIENIGAVMPQLSTNLTVGCSDSHQSTWSWWKGFSPAREYSFHLRWTFPTHSDTRLQISMWFRIQFWAFRFLFIIFVSYRESHDSWIKIAIELKELIQNFIVPHEEDVLTVKPNVKSSAESADDTKSKKIQTWRKRTITNLISPHHSECQKFLRIVREVHREICQKQSCERAAFLKPHCKKSEECGTKNGPEKPSPVVSHCEVSGGYFDTKQNTAYWCREARANLKTVE